MFKPLLEKRKIVDVFRAGKSISCLKIYNGRAGVKRDAEAYIKNGGVHQKLKFICIANHWNGSFLYLRKTFGFQKEILRKHMDHEENNEDT